MTEREFQKLATLIFNAQWAVAGFRYSNRSSDWRAKDARRAAEYILTEYELTPRRADGEEVDRS